MQRKHLNKGAFPGATPANPLSDYWERTIFTFDIRWITLSRFPPYWRGKAKMLQ